MRREEGSAEREEARWRGEEKENLRARLKEGKEDLRSGVAVEGILGVEWEETREGGRGFSCEGVEVERMRGEGFSGEEKRGEWGWGEEWGEEAEWEERAGEWAEAGEWEEYERVRDSLRAAAGGGGEGVVVRMSGGESESDASPDDDVVVANDAMECAKGMDSIDFDFVGACEDFCGDAVGLLLWRGDGGTNAD